MIIIFFRYDYQGDNQSEYWDSNDEDVDDHNRDKNDYRKEKEGDEEE